MYTHYYCILVFITPFITVLTRLPYDFLYYVIVLRIYNMIHYCLQYIVIMTLAYIHVYICYLNYPSYVFIFHQIQFIFIIYVSMVYIFQTNQHAAGSPRGSAGCRMLLDLKLCRAVGIRIADGLGINMLVSRCQYLYVTITMSIYVWHGSSLSSSASRKTAMLQLMLFWIDEPGHVATLC